jgi:hypothetical protein
MASKRFADKQNLKDVVGGLKAKFEPKDATIVKDGAYVHTDSNFTSAEKTKLAGIEEGATNTVDTNTTYKLSLSGTTVSLSEGGSPTVPGEITHDATTTSSGLMSATDKAKLDGVAQGAEVNQPAFGRVAVGQSVVTSDSKVGTLTVEAGDNVTVEADVETDTVTISAATYEATTDDVGSASEGTPITADDITGWEAGTLPTAVLSGTTLVVRSGTLPSLSYEARTVPNVSVTQKTVVTAITAS